MLSLLFVMAALGGEPVAHHSQVRFDPNERPKELKGVVAEYRWRNPHVLFLWDVRDESAKVVRWTAEFGSVALSLSRGMSRSTFRVGEAVTVTLVPSRDGAPVGQIRRVVKVDGTVIAGASE